MHYEEMVVIFLLKESLKHLKNCPVYLANNIILQPGQFPDFL